jgi:hypothetical protein
MDWDPLIDWFKQLTQKTNEVRVTAIDMFFIFGTTVVTVVDSLNTAVILFTVLYYIIKKVKPATAESGMGAQQ